jgi:hypothetical protein
MRRHREKRMTGHTMAAAAAAAGVSERTARRWQTPGLPSETVAARTDLTRPNPFVDVWAIDIEPHVVADRKRRLQALTVFDWLYEPQPGRFQPGQVRTLPRRVREWRARDGPAPDVFFDQTAVPGREAAVDFTDGTVRAVAEAPAAAG